MLCTFSEDTLTIVRIGSTEQERIGFPVLNIEFLLYIRCFAIENNAQFDERRVFRLRKITDDAFIDELNQGVLFLYIPFQFHIVVIWVIDIGSESIVLIDIENSIARNEGRYRVIDRHFGRFGPGILLIHLQHHHIVSGTLIDMRGGFEGRGRTVSERPLPIFARIREIGEINRLSRPWFIGAEGEIDIIFLARYQRATDRQ